MIGSRLSEQLDRLSPWRTADATSIFLEPGKRTVMAHRGDRANHPPGNHWSAFEGALEAGVEHIESDVHLTADGQLVLFHDDELDGETTGSGPIAAARWSELEQLRYRHGEHILDDGLVRLGDALERWPDVRWNIDAKNRDAVEPLIDLIGSTESAHRLLVTSFGFRALRRIRDLAPPPLCTGVAMPEVVALKLASTLGLPAPTFGDAVQVPETHRGITLVDDRFVRTCHRAGMAVHVWTVNEPTAMRRLFALGVDGIITDDPARLVTALEVDQSTQETDDDKR